MSDFTANLRTVLAGKPLSRDEMAVAIGDLMDGEWSPVQAAAFLAALAAKGETADEIVGAATAMRGRSVKVEHDVPVVMDVCGTGGDASNTINVSTCAGLVVAACGVAVAKHGNRAASSECGSADVLEAAGVPLDETPEQSGARLGKDRFCFLFAQRYHPAMKVVAPVRRELRVRTVFNLLGPLTNPAHATHQMIGVAQEAHLELVGEALRGLGARSGAVVHASNGIDEIAGDASTHVFAFGPFGSRRFLLDPAAYGVHATMADLAGGSPAHNARSMLAILEGERSPRADVVALNAALALVVAERAESIDEGLTLAREAMRSGAALDVLESLRRPMELQCA